MTEWGRRRVRRRSQSLVPPGEVVGYAVCARSSGFGAFFVPYFVAFMAFSVAGVLFLVPRLPWTVGPGNSVFWVGWQVAAVVAGWAVACLFNRNWILAVTDRSICVLDCGHFLSGVPRRIAEVLPRQFLAPAPGSWSRIGVAGVPLLVPMNWRSELSAANSDLVTSDAS